MDDRVESDTSSPESFARQLPPAPWSRSVEVPYPRTWASTALGLAALDTIRRHARGPTSTTTTMQLSDQQLFARCQCGHIRTRNYGRTRQDGICDRCFCPRFM